MASMRYSNPAGRHGFLRGFKALSPEKGKTIWDEITVHDDGQLGYGGTRTFGIGGQGSGKTTLNTKFARQSYYVEGINKFDFMKSMEEATDADEWMDYYGKKLHHETTLWRGREFDSWNVLVPGIFETCYPHEYVKPLRVHVHKESDFSFCEQNFDTAEITEIKNLDVVKYRNVKEIYDNIVEGGNNIIYPPLKHYMSGRLKNSINTKRNLSMRDRRYMSPDEDYLVERDVFLFEIFEYMYRVNVEGINRRWFTAIIDESHDLFRANAPDIYYWIIECMVDVLIDTRKHNLSLACMTHALNLIDYRILERSSNFLWLKGSKPSSSYSVVDSRLIAKLETGECVIESKMNGKIGGFTFNRIPNNVSRLLVKGMNTSEDIDNDKDEFAAVTTEDGYDNDEIDNGIDDEIEIETLPRTDPDWIFAQRNGGVV